MALSSREKQTVLVGGVTALLVAVVTWGILPLRHSWCRMGDELAPKVQALREARARLDRRQTLLARRVRLVKQMGWLVPPDEEQEDPAEESKPGNPDAKPPDAASDAERKADARPPERPGFEAELEKTAGKCKVELKSLVGERDRPGADLTCFQRQAFRVEAEAKPEAVVALLHALEKGPRLVRVDELTVRRDVSKPGPAKITFQVAAYERTTEP